MAGTITHSWNGTILTITSDSGTSSMDLKGGPGDIGPRGPQGPAGIIINPDGTINFNGYATEEYVDDKIATIDLSELDFSNYYTKSEVDEAIANIDISDVNLSNYYTKSETDDLIQNIELTPGPKGEPGYTPVKGVDYFDGEAGYTPVKGTDYYTDADKVEMVQMVLEALPAAEEGEF